MSEALLHVFNDVKSFFGVQQYMKKAESTTVRSVGAKLYKAKTSEKEYK